DDRDDLRPSAGQEDLVGRVDVMSRQGDLLDDDTGRLGQLDDRVAGHAFEDAGVDGRSAQQTVLDEKDIVSGAFGHLALVVEHEGFLTAGAVGLDLGEDVVEVVERLDPRAQRVGVVADDRRGDDLHAFFVELGWIEADVIDDDDDLRVGTLVGVEAEGAGAAGDDETDVAVLLALGLDGPQDFLVHAVARPGDLQVEVFGALVEAFDVLVKAEDLAGVDTDALENAVAVEQAVVVDRDGGAGLVDELAVDVDLGHPRPP